MIEKNSFNYAKKQIVYIFLAILFLGNLILVANKSIWYDESYSLNLVQGNFIDIITGTAQDVHPPLYYLILKIGLMIGNGLLGINAIYVAKFVSLIPILLTVLINHLWVEKWTGKSMWLHSFCVLTMPRIISHAGIEIRMYSWAALFVYIAFLCAVKIISGGGIKKKLWCLLTVSSLSAAYCHYFACIAAFFVYIGLFVLVLFSDEKKIIIGKLFISGIGVFVGYIPWLIVLFGQLKAVENEYWIGRVGRSACIQIMEFPFGDNATPWDMACFLLLVIAVLFSLISLIGILRNKDVKIAFFALSILALTVITGVVVSRVFRPVFVPRYMIPTLFCFWFGIIWLTKEAGTIRKNIIVLMLIAGGLYSFLSLCRDEFLLKHQVHRMLDIIEITTENENIYVTDSRHVHHILQQYCEGKSQVYLVKGAEDWEQIEDFDNVRYAVALKDDFLESDIGSSWDNLGECRLEVYDTVVYEK